MQKGLYLSHYYSYSMLKCGAIVAITVIHNTYSTNKLCEICFHENTQFFLLFF